MAAGEDYTADHSIFTQPGIIGRTEVSPAKKVQTVRAQVTLQPSQKGTKKLRAQ